MQEKLIIVAAPSGAGKTTIVRHLLEQMPNLSFSISATSREPRGKEANGKDYYFLGVEGFKQKIKEDAFLEWEEVYANQFYGTLKSEVERLWKMGKTVIFDIDVIGALNLKSQFNEKALSIFIMPPDKETLEQRLRQRQTETEEKIQMRLNKAEEEMEKSSDFDQVLLNKDLKTAQKKAIKLIENFLHS